MTACVRERRIGMSALSSAPPKDSGTAGAPAAVEFRYTQTESFAALLHELAA
jgi:hypothetical protein